MPQEKEGFINSNALTKLVRLLIYAQILVALASITSGYMEYQLLSDYENGIYTSQEQAAADGEASDNRQSIIATIYLILYVISGFIILKWIYRANYNARQLGGENMKFTPGWSIGWFFIPIFTLWKPYQAMKEIWKFSNNPNDWSSAKVSLILPCWWFFWLLANFLGQAVMRMSLRAKEIPELKSVNLIYQASDVASIFLAIATLALVNRIYQAQISHVYNHS